VALLALPAVYGDAYVMRILTMTCIFAIFAASWDLLAGYTGQVNSATRCSSAPAPTPRH